MNLINSPSTGQQGSATWNAGCTATEVVGDAVYILSAGQVRQAQANVLATSLVVGVVTSKASDTTCVVTSAGTATVTGLTAGSVHYLSEITAGAIADAEPSGGNHIVMVGMASEVDALVVEIGEPEYKS
jgi:hypothetical protein